MNVRAKMVSDSENQFYNKYRDIKHPQQHHIIEAMKNNTFQYILELLGDNDIDQDIRGSWKKLLDDFFYK